MLNESQRPCLAASQALLSSLQSFFGPRSRQPVVPVQSAGVPAPTGRLLATHLTMVCAGLLEVWQTVADLADALGLDEQPSLESIAEDLHLHGPSKGARSIVSCSMRCVALCIKGHAGRLHEQPSLESLAEDLHLYGPSKGALCIGCIMRCIVLCSKVLAGIAEDFHLHDPSTGAHVSGCIMHCTDCVPRGALRKKINTTWRASLRTSMAQHKEWLMTRKAPANLPHRRHGFRLNEQPVLKSILLDTHIAAGGTHEKM